MECKSCQKPKAQHRKGLWSPEEDQKLRDYIIRYGHSCWSTVPVKAGLHRNGKSCRLRWINYLRPGLKHGMFSGEEEDTVMRLHATLGNKCGEVACNLHKMEKALNGTFLNIRSCNESTTHPAYGPLIQALQDFVQSAHHSSHVLDCWASKLEEDAEMVRPGEKGGKYIFLLNNTCAVLQMIRRQGPSFSNVEVVSRLSSMIQRYTKSYKDECWLPLNNTLHSNLDEFTAEFLATCDNQSSWKVTAELRYDLREEIVDLIVPSYKVSLSALQADRSRLSGVLCSFKRVTAGKKKQKRYTGEELEREIRALFEG